MSLKPLSCKKGIFWCSKLEPLALTARPGLCTLCTRRVGHKKCTPGSSAPSVLERSHSDVLKYGHGSYNTEIQKCVFLRIISYYTDVWMSKIRQNIYI